MRIIKPHTLLIAIIAISAFAVTAQQTNTDDSELRALVSLMTKAQVKFQPDVLDKIFASDYIEISPIGEFDERSKVLGFYDPKQRPNGSTTKVEADEFSIRNYGTFAIVITRLNFVITVDGKTVPPRSMRAMIVCRNLKGKWKIASVQYTGIRPPAPSKN